MIEFNEKETKFLNSLEEARIATSHDDIPHVKPVSFVLDENAIIIATDYETRTYKNLKTNPNSSVVIDIYKSGGHKAVLIQGKTKIIENGEEFKKLYDIFFEKFEWVRRDSWKENEAPFLKVIPKNKTSWGLDTR
ncbi:pyridoxamine 5'-phosphate oxidase-like FMN-binding protein [Marine Group I thaumarchaeote SCGC AAA799-B03]|uniref:Pyridoxamine 5'-phosphate oxidase-like FMN-binding protein n=4 Tax=Marine Group I TaxID=905826 RepID=A0A087S5R0_9ARCH|nr:pyridoxamine 5'-phosphate oxidase-like FMN-binding protein [Marine Group I thaumarchaeote SCGC AAA799-N04]KFM15962.1 pyridoxamine 5'-phosphate oxidase-like FMN-binding protein [Marine Group I thaumarchaeote SCGC AAA799-D11]KFM17699.1 pyridoxamine 5'-phosphate oxidase-like FMN-binding protein [Marine Group I thaumarchaeote SCGC RSA3]KFM21064.1 pyridoxamine 5'-phosphate oxidase-like FMN-binding protein [Marine Group I thaumarchaeote SCGC AAA799-B03]